MKKRYFLLLSVLVVAPLFGFDNLTPEFPPTFQAGPFPLGTEPVRNDAPVDETDPNGVLHEYTAYKGTVVVDGRVDDAEWAKIPWTLMEFNYDVTVSQEGSLWSTDWAPTAWDSWEDLTAWFKVLHDDDFIYLAVMRYDDDYSFDPATHNSTGNIWQNDAYQMIVDTRYPGAFDDAMPGAEIGVCLVDGEEAYNFWPTSHQNPAVRLELADGDCPSTITTAAGKAIRGFITPIATGNMEVIEAAFLKYPEMEYDMVGMFSVCALDRDYDKRESVNQWAQGIYVKDKAQYGSILWSSASAPTTAVKANAVVPATYAMSNYPNPFNPTTTIAYTLAKPEAVSIKVYSIAGKLVAQLLSNELQNAGTHEVTFDGSSLDSGVFFYQLQTASAALLGKMTLVK